MEINMKKQAAHLLMLLYLLIILLSAVPSWARLPVRELQCAGEACGSRSDPSDHGR
ncbi:hypothetical protein LINGRAHAP2_LOCUS11400 [Linum grandiflorum]